MFTCFWWWMATYCLYLLHLAFFFHITFYEMVTCILIFRLFLCFIIINSPNWNSVQTCTLVRISLAIALNFSTGFLQVCTLLCPCLWTSPRGSLSLMWGWLGQRKALTGHQRTTGTWVSLAPSLPRRLTWLLSLVENHLSVAQPSLAATTLSHGSSNPSIPSSIGLLVTPCWQWSWIIAVLCWFFLSLPKTLPMIPLWHSP